MKAHILLFITILLTPVVSAQVAGPLAGKPTNNSTWVGSFLGDINGTNSILSLSLNGTLLNGEINADGYIYLLEGTVDGNQSTGKVTDKITGGVLDYMAHLQADQLDMKLIFRDQFGQSVEIPVQFRREAAGAGSQMSAGQNSTMQNSTRQNTAGYNSFGNSSGNTASGTTSGIQRDPYLFGGWRHTETYTSGEFSTVSEWYMNVNRDGTYTYGDGQIAGGGDGYSFGSGGGGDRTTGQWKTENGVVYINEGYGWQPYAKYYIEGNSMMFTFGDGSKQLWERYR